MRARPLFPDLEQARYRIILMAMAAVGQGQANAAWTYLTAHEWGTFTTLSTSEGKPLPGLFIDASPLPDFVPTLPFYANAPAPLHALAHGGQGPSENGDEACAAKWKNVTVKMETPVLYFYRAMPDSLPIEVMAGFPGGALHQYYPPRQGGETNPTGTQVDFALPGLRGELIWKATVLSDTSSRPLAHADVASQEWSAPRQTKSNKVMAEGAVEKYLFYRGLGGATAHKGLPLKMRFADKSHIALTNDGKDPISHIVIYEQSYTSLSQAGTVWWEGSLGARESKTVLLDSALLPESSADRQAGFDSMLAHLKNALIDQGLYQDEAQAMLNTWQRSYWGDEKGFKVFWTVPRAVIDSMLPLRITSPDAFEFTLDLKRVFLARSEILTPDFEAQLRAGLRIEDGDRHRLAYAAYRNSTTSSQPSKTKGKTAMSPRRKHAATPSLIPLFSYPAPDGRNRARQP